MQNYGPEMAKRMLADMAKVSGGSMGPGNDPSLIGYAPKIPTPNVSNFAPMTQAQGFTGGQGVQTQAPMQAPPTALTGPGGGSIQIDPLGYTRWGGQGPGTGNSFGGFQGSYDPFGMYQSRGGGQGTGGSQVLQLLTLLALLGG